MTLITILTAGTRGDTQPFIALGLGLQRAGYQVRLASSENFATMTQGLDFFPIGTSMTELMKSSEVQAVLEVDNPLQGLLTQLRVSRGRTIFDDMQQDVWNACQDADAIVYHPGMISGHFIAKHLGIPGIMASVFPISPTRYWPSALFYDGPRMGTVYNRVTHTIFEQVFWQMSRSPIKSFWRKQGLSIPFMPPYRGLPILYGYSEHAMPRPADWPSYLKMTGYWFLDTATHWQPPVKLLDFLKSGPPPVYVGFGSMGNLRRAKETTEITVEALQRSGQRGVLVSGWNSMSHEISLPDNIIMLSDVPHSWLFPRMAAVVHHGGAGTTAAGLRAGVPTLVVPHGVDQPMWGRRVMELGVGPKPIPRKQLTAENLSTAIHAALHKDIQAKAQHIGHKIRAEDGVARAVEIIDQTLRQGTYA